MAKAVYLYGHREMAAVTMTTATVMGTQIAFTQSQQGQLRLRVKDHGI